MKKTLGAFVAEVYKPKSPDEQKFVDKHVVINHKDRNGNGDDVFSATNIKTVERKKTNKGYDVGDDEKVYEAIDIDPGLEDELMSQRAGEDGADWRAKKKLVGNQHKIDANGNGKIDAHDFHLLRKKKKVAEEVEELDESAKIAAHLIKRYGENVRKSHVRSAANDFGVGYVALSHAVRKKLGVNRLEEEQLDELSKKTLGSYINKAAERIGTQGVTAGLKIAADEKSQKNFKSMGKRQKGVERAVKKLTKEEAEQIDELSSKKLIDYTAKASDARGHRKLSTAKLDKRYKGMALAHEKIRGRRVKVMASEEVEQIDELSKGKMLKYLAANKKDDAKAREKGDVDKMTKRMRGTDVAVRKYTAKPGSKYVRVPATEEVQIDEALDAGDRYNQHHVAIKELMKSIGEHIDNHKKDAQEYKDYRGKKGTNWGHVGDLASVHSQLAHIHDRLAQQGEYKKAMHESVEDFTDEDYQQIDELSKDTIRSYYNKAGDQGRKIMGKMMVGGGDWSKDEKDTKTLYKRGKGRQMALKRRRGEVKMSEEAEQIDELSRDTLRRYRMKSKSIGDNEKGDVNYRSKGRDLAARKTHGGQWGMPKAKVMASEEVEQVEESWLPKSVHAELKRMPKDAVKRTHDTYMTTAKGFKRNGHHALAAQAHDAAAEIKQKYLGEENETDADEISLAEMLAFKTINSITRGE